MIRDRQKDVLIVFQTHLRLFENRLGEGEMCGVKKKIWAAVLCGLVLLMCCAATACRSRAEREKAQANVPEFVLTYAENQA